MNNLLDNLYVLLQKLEKIEQKLNEIKDRSHYKNYQK